MNNGVLPFHGLAERHYGLTEAIGNTYTEAARICLDRHHASPVAILIVAPQAEHNTMAVWQRTDERTRGAWANEIDATEMGAYGLALAAVEVAERMFAIRRAETGSGADYYVAPVDASRDDLESWYRLEVSGSDKGDEQSVRHRLNEKVRQTLRGASNIPALAAVVGFKARYVAIARVEAS